jgi:hypothetical protein
MALKLVWRFVNSVQRRARSKQNVVCVKVDQRITRSKSDIASVWAQTWIVRQNSAG